MEVLEDDAFDDSLRPVVGVLVTVVVVLVVIFGNEFGFVFLSFSDAIVFEGAVDLSGDGGAAGVGAVLVELGLGLALPWPSGRRLELLDAALIFLLL